MTTISLFLYATIIILIISLTYRKFKTSGEIFTPWTIFSALSIIDIYIPAFLALSINGKLSAASWMVPIEPETTAEAALIFSIGHIFFSIGYFSIKNKPKQKTHFTINIKVAYSIFFISTLIYLLSLYLEISRSGGLSEYISYKLLTRWDPNHIQSLTPFEELIATLTPSLLNISLIITGILFYHAEKINKKPLLKITLVLVGFAVCSTTFFRGTYIKFIIGLTCAAILAKKERLPEQIFLKNSTATTKKILLATVLIFVFTGALRQYFSAQEWGNEESPKSQITAIEKIQSAFSGSGLIGLGSIVENYGTKIDYLYGKTIYDVMLRPIPRFLYPSKPQWYGIDDITRGLGWPESTQSAVTPQGEFFANFGLAGILAMTILGVTFSYLTKLFSSSTRKQFLYFFIILPSVTTTFWMSFTGLMNSILTLPIAFLAIAPIFQKIKKS